MNPSVTLICTSYHKAELANDGVFRLGPGGGSIGRNSSCDIVLPDPQKVISGCHARIAANGTDLLIYDESTNGLFIDGSQSPLGRGNSATMRDGMQLGFGDFLFSVVFETTASAGLTTSNPGSMGTDFDNSSFDPLADIGAAPQNHVPDGFSGRSSSANSIPEMVIPEGTGGTSGDPFFDPLASGGGTQEVDPGLGILDTREAFSPPPQSAALDHGDPLSDPFKAPDGQRDESLSGGLSSTSEGGESIIPEDWMADDLLPEPTSPTATSPPSAPATDTAAMEANPAAATASAVTGAVEPSAPTAPNLAAPAASGEAGAGAAATAMQQNTPASINEVTGSVAHPTEGAVTIEDTTTTGTDFEDLVLRGLMDLLAARATLKNELRMGATLIRQAENNPLKFAANVAAAKVLFAESSKNNAYLSRIEAVTQALEEVQAHQMALLIGMRAAFNQLLKTFAPENFEDKQGAGLGKIVSSSEKKAWLAYQRFFKERVTRSDDPFQELFSAALSKAYMSALDND